MKGDKKTFQTGIEIELLFFFHPGEFEPFVTRGVWAFSTVWTSLQTRGMDTSTASQQIHFLVWVIFFPCRGTCLFFYLNGYRKKPATFAQDEVAEWLRRWTANPLGSARVGSNPILVDCFSSEMILKLRDISFMNHHTI